MMRVLFTFLTIVCVLICFGQNPKLSSSLNRLQQTATETDSIDVSVSFKPNASQNKVVGGRRLTNYTAGNIILVRMRLADIKRLATQEDIQFINIIHTAKEELTTGSVDYTLNKINYLHRQFPNTVGIDIKASIKERLFDTTDIDLKGRVFKTGLENNLTTAHASLMATIVAGAGNSSPDALGVSPAAQLTSSSFERLFPDADSIFLRNKISVQNHSYGTVVENFYGNEAAAYDAQVYANPTLLHVFSAGNAGGSNPASGTYLPVAQMANLSGNFKQAKNILTVSATDSVNNVLQYSSKGPAYDGRVKPELVAYGEDGSSGAAALVSGTAIAVQDAYKKVSNNTVPPAQLVKAVLINSADEVGATGVDYLGGFGSLNANKAVETIAQKHFFESEVVAGQTKSFSLTVPAAVSKLKITLAWNERPALPNAAKALLNDIDLSIKNAATNNVFLPWILNPAPVKDSLLLVAKRGIDTLNNVEQITIDHPEAGSYTIEVNASKLASGSQLFALAYQYDTASVFQWTYPTAGDPLVAAKNYKLRWATTISGNGTISYATNNNNWRDIATPADLKNSYTNWHLPDTNTTVVLRMSFGGSQYLSDTFTISRVPGLEVGFNCADSFLLYWQKEANHSFQLYELGEKYLQPALLTTDSFVIFKKQMHPSHYYAVAPIVNGKIGKRSSTLNYNAEAVDCYFRSFFLQLQEDKRATFTGSIGTDYGVAAVRFQKLTDTGFTTLTNQPNNFTNQFSFTDPQLTRGVNRFRLQLLLANGQVVNSNLVEVYYFPDTEVIIFPNPAQQGQKINFATSKAGRVKISIYNSGGMLMMERALSELNQQMDGVLLPKGLYLVRISGEGSQQTHKLVVQ